MDFVYPIPQLDYFTEILHKILHMNQAIFSSPEKARFLHMVYDQSLYNKGALVTNSRHVCSDSDLPNMKNSYSLHLP